MLTIGLIAINALVFLAQSVLPGSSVAINLGLAPAVAELEPYRMLTSAFLHGSIFHLLLNMYALWIVGSYLEPMLGRWRYLTLYFLSAIGGSVAVVLASPASSALVITVGASGAVFGLFGALALVLRKVGGNATGILVIIAINVVFTFTVPNISIQGHIGGLIVGLALGAVFAYLPTTSQLHGMDREQGHRLRTRYSLTGAIAVAIILVGLAFVGFAGPYF